MNEWWLLTQSLSLSWLVSLLLAQSCLLIITFRKLLWILLHYLWAPHVVSFNKIKSYQKAWMDELCMHVVRINKRKFPSGINSVHLLLFRQCISASEVHFIVTAIILWNYLCSLKCHTWIHSIEWWNDSTIHVWTPLRQNHTFSSTFACLSTVGIIGFLSQCSFACFMINL